MQFDDVYRAVQLNDTIKIYEIKKKVNSAIWLYRGLWLNDTVITRFTFKEVSFSACKHTHSALEYLKLNHSGTY